MHQSLQASRAVQTMKKAEEQLEKERVVRRLVQGKNGFGASVLGGKLLVVVRMEVVHQDRQVLANMEDRLYQLEDERTLTRLQPPVHDGL
jgi:hypothetical protein